MTEMLVNRKSWVLEIGFPESEIDNVFIMDYLRFYEQRKNSFENVFWCFIYCLKAMAATQFKFPSSVKDVDQHKFVKAFAQFLKK